MELVRLQILDAFILYLSANDNPKKTLPSLMRSRSPKRIEVTPTVAIPTLSVVFMPKRFKLAPIIGLTKNTVSSKIPKTRPYSDGTHPFFSASWG